MPSTPQSRSSRAQSRSKAKEDIVRKATVISRKVRKWEKRWVSVEGSTMKVFKWMPVSSSEPALASLKMTLVTHSKGGKKGRVDSRSINKDYSASFSNGLPDPAPHTSRASSETWDSSSETNNDNSNMSFPDTSESQSQMGQPSTSQQDSESFLMQMSLTMDMLTQKQGLNGGNDASALAPNRPQPLAAENGWTFGHGVTVGSREQQN
ncbi:uncharacterized protein LOC143274967 [Babylonia areolata]|uniref:uncharacterized protein LOC143274967 n=1 Tax=Babylonia areolata TaxID=304850 RepID=UPI003FD05D0D